MSDVSAYETGNYLELKNLLNDLVVTIILQTDQIKIMFKVKTVTTRFGIKAPDDAKIVLTKPMDIRRRGQEMKMVIGGQELRASNPEDVLIKLVAKAHLLKTELETGTVTSIKGFAVKYEMDHGDAKNLIPVSFLAPSIIEDILTGYQPVDLTARRLKYLSNLPISWTDQRQFLGFHQHHL